MGGYLVVFTQAIPDHYCKNPVLETTYNKNETEIKNLSIPSEYNEKCEIIEYSSCEEYNLDWSICDPSSGNFCTDDQLTELSNSINSLDESDQNVLCRNGYVWDNSTYASTAAEDFELVCTPSGVTLQVLTTSINYVGFIVGSFLTGWISDTYGRKWLMIVTQILYSVIMMLGGFTTNVYSYLVIRFLQGVTGISCYLAAFCYLVEVVPIKWRSAAGFSLHIFYCFGEFILAGMASVLTDWRALSKWMIITVVPMVLYFPIPESPAFLFSKRRIQAAAEIYANFGKKNKAGSDVHEIEGLLSKIAKQDDDEKKDKDQSSQNNKVWTMKDLFTTNRGTTIMTLKVAIAWFATSTVYYGIGLSAGSLPVSTVVSIAIYGAVDVVSHIVFPWLMEKPMFGRKFVVSGSLILTGFCLLGSTFSILYVPCQNKIDSGEASDFLNTLNLVFTFVGRFFIGGTFGAVYQFTGEVYPTPIRSNGVSLGSVVGKIGTTLTPAFLALRIIADWVPGVIFSILAIVAGILCLTIPETRGLPILNTFEEAEMLYNGSIREYLKGKGDENGQVSGSVGENNKSFD